MSLEVLQQPNPILREKSHKIEKITADIFTLARDMLEAMYQNQGVGLAAPQVGHPIRMIVIDASAEHNSPGVIINPEISSHSKNKVESIEGCLSCRGFEGLVERFEKVTVKGKNLSGKAVTMKADGLLARALQHEIDHLNGIIIVDIAKPIPPEEKKDLEEIGKII